MVKKNGVETNIAEYYETNYMLLQLAKTTQPNTKIFDFSIVITNNDNKQSLCFLKWAQNGMQDNRCTELGYNHQEPERKTHLPTNNSQLKE